MEGTGWQMGGAVEGDLEGWVRPIVMVTTEAPACCSGGEGGEGGFEEIEQSRPRQSLKL